MATACTPTTAELAGPDGISGVVTWIYDGDTIVVETVQDTIDVRLLDINAPEGDECFYKESLDHLISTLKGRSVTLEIRKDLDQFGRTLAYVWDGNTNVNLEMVKMGLAITTTSDSGSGFSAEENEAVAGEFGLWAEDACGSGPIPNVVIAALDAYEETIVIVNNESAVADLSGWTLRDESSRHRYRFPTGASLQPGDKLTIGSDDSLWDPGGSPVWNNDGDMALLLDRHGRVAHRWRY